MQLREANVRLRRRELGEMQLREANARLRRRELGEMQLREGNVRLRRRELGEMREGGGRKNLRLLLLSLDIAVITDTQPVEIWLVKHARKIPMVALHLRKSVSILDARIEGRLMILYQMNTPKISVEKSGVKDFQPVQSGNPATARMPLRIILTKEEGKRRSRN